MAYMEAERTEPPGLADQVDEAVKRLEEQAGKRLGDPEDPLLVSVRSGARESMPGMLDTVLNLGLNDESVEGSPRRPGTSVSPGTPTAASCRCSATSCATSGERVRARDRRGASEARGREARHRARLPAPARAGRRVQGALEDDFPHDPRAPARRRRSARCSTRGRASGPSQYRRINRIPDTWGTAVNVQQMVFGNKGDDVVLGRRLQPRRDHRRAGAERRLPGERAGRGRGLRRAHAADLSELRGA